MMDDAAILAIERVTYTYSARATLTFPDFSLMSGDIAALVGPSGSGKSTLLMLIAGLLEQQTGRIRVAGMTPAQLHGGARDRWRGRTIGIVLQSFQLLTRLSVLENLTAAQYLSGNEVDVRAARDTLSALDIVDLADERPGRMSSGQIQRAAIARAVVNRPRMLLADEPTSTLDDDSAEAALALMLGQTRRLGAALLIATHDSRVKAHVPATIELRQVLHA